MLAQGWEDYKILGTGDGLKLELWKDIMLLRPDPQAIWRATVDYKKFDTHARYERDRAGGGRWIVNKPMPDEWQVSWRDCSFYVKPTGFKHTGLFPEQAVNWDMIREVIRNSGRKDVKVLNLFAYTGGATVACLKEGASVVHVDASKGMTLWAKENAASSRVADLSVRWIVDDCIKFVQREIRRGNRYDIIIMDPPSYGRGPGGEVWKLENEIYSFAELCSQLLSDDPLMMLVNSYTTGLSPSVMEYILGAVVKKRFSGAVHGSEIGLRTTENGLVLPCGASAFWTKHK